MNVDIPFENYNAHTLLCFLAAAIVMLIAIVITISCVLLHRVKHTKAQQLFIIEETASMLSGLSLALLVTGVLALFL